MKDCTMKDWKTTLGGILNSLGLAATLWPDGRVAAIGTAVAAVGALIAGTAAQDSSVGKTAPERR